MDGKKMTIGVFFGSRNPEHDVSIITGQMIIAELRKIGYRAVPIYLDKKGHWFSGEALGFLKFFTEPSLEDRLNRLKECFIKIDAQNHNLVLKTKKIFFEEIVIDFAFPAFHGMNGEDGTIQGLFELCNLPYAGCEVACSAITMDKIITKQIYESKGIPTTPFMYFSGNDWKENKAQIIETIKKLPWPLFVKPARLGSSIGITKVRDIEELENACEVALHYDSRVIIEESVEELMDITCAILGNENPLPSLIQESVFNGEHFSYEAKYLENGGVQLGNAQKNIIIPALLDEKTTKEVQNMALRIFKLFDCTGIARIDFLYDAANKKIYANEINTMPGTLYHHLWKASGVEMSALLEKLIDLAKQRHEEKNKITATFKSDILDYANSIKLKIRQ